MSRHFKYAFLSFLFLLVQTKVMNLISLEGITPDALAIWVIYIALKEGQMYAMPWGFGVGLLFDLATGNVIGLSAFTKTVAAFIAGYFYNENKTPLTLGSYRFLVIVLFVSLIHNTMYFIIFTRGSDISLLQAVFQVGLATTFYTSTLTLLPMLVFSRRFIT